MPNIIFFAKTDFRGEGKIFGIKKEDRRLHLYIADKTGLENTPLISNGFEQGITTRLNPKSYFLKKLNTTFPGLLGQLY